jgi:CBS domain-containing protein
MYNRIALSDPLHPLNQPVSALMRYVEAVGPEDSLARAAWLLRAGPSELVPVVQGGRLVGALSERDLSRALGAGVGSLSSVSAALNSAPETIPFYSTGAEGLRRLAENDGSPLLVVDAHGGYLGVLGPSDLFPRHEIPPLLPMIGGMATPFGVYLTAGGVRAGAGQLALIATGMSLAVLLLAATFASGWLAHVGTEGFGWRAYEGPIAEALSVALFFVGMRAAPLSGTHAAEHKVVHALEAGEPLELEVVKRMPRVHPRCGTNLAVAAALLLGLASWRWTADEHLRMLVALLVTVFVWRPIGNAMQFLVTTKPPSDRQILGGIAAGKELIENFRHARRGRIQFWQKILASGMLHVMAGSMLTFGLAMLLGKAFGIEFVL